MNISRRTILTAITYLLISLVNKRTKSNSRNESVMYLRGKREKWGKRGPLSPVPLMVDQVAG